MADRTIVTEPMPQLELAGVPQSVSRLVIGADHQRSDTHASALFDLFVERGGNAFDTAWNYDEEMCGGDHCERRLGRYLGSRGLRQDVVLIGKGAHTPDCHPAAVRPQLVESLERLGTERLDIYLLHRDNPEVPVGEFVDALNRMRDEGLTCTFGVSNWSRDRVDAACAYAGENGLTPPSVLSNQFSLAEMLEPLWSGSQSASSADWRRWLVARRIPLIGWSSLARGFLALGARDEPADAAMRRCWHSSENLGRRARLHELARERGVTAAALGVAFVLRQPFPTLALIGPRTLAELADTLGAPGASLSDDDVDYLLGQAQPRRLAGGAA